MGLPRWSEGEASPPRAAAQTQSLGGELRPSVSHPQGENRSGILTGPVKTSQMVHIKEKIFKKHDRVLQKEEACWSNL